MNKLPWLLLGLASAAALVGSTPPARAAFERDGALLVRADGTAWLWSGDGHVAPLIQLADVRASGRLRGQAVWVKGDGSVWSTPFGAWASAARLWSAPALRTLTCAGDQCLGLTRDDDVVTWWGGERWQPVPGLTDVAALAASDTHALAVSHSGQVWAWNLGPERATALDPAPIPGLVGALDVTLSDTHGAASTRTGGVFVWSLASGDNSAAVALPRLPPSVQVLVGHDELWILTQSGTVWRWDARTRAARLVETPGEFVALHVVDDTILGARARLGRRSRRAYSCGRSRDGDRNGCRDGC